jgi:hypothetical protein
MFFKKKLSVEDYCIMNLTPLFSKEREIAWETLRHASDDSQLVAVDSQLYTNHLRAIFIQLMLIAITKNCRMQASSDAHFFVMEYLKEHNLSEIYEISKGYNQAFGSSYTDGVRQMVLHFADRLTAGKIRAATIEQFYAEFYGILRIFFDDFKKFKLFS